jgi:tetratricopeptide (TPR) repeat protein
VKPTCLFLLLIASTTGCSSIQSMKRLAKESKPRSEASGSPMSQLGVALPAMKPSDERELKIIAADELSKKGYWNEAVELYLEAETMKPTKKRLDAQLAAAFAGAGRFRESVERYERLIDESPKQVSNYNNLGVTLMESGDLIAAEKRLRQGLAINKSDERLAINLGLVVARQKRYEEAAELMIPFIGAGAAYHNVGIIAVDLDDEVSARSFFQAAASSGDAPKQTSNFVASLK